jgi:hypothetical protein
MVPSVEGSNIAHDLPELYRAVLERIASLEATGRHAEALLVRRAAIQAYSEAWDDTAVRRLERLRNRAERVLDGHERPRPAHTARTPRRTWPRVTLRWSRTG